MKSIRKATGFGLTMASACIILVLSSCGTNPMAPGNLNSVGNSDNGLYQRAAIDTLTAPAPAIDTLTLPAIDTLTGTDAGAIDTLTRPAIDTLTDWPN